MPRDPLYPSFSEGEFARRQAAVRASMSQRGLDGLLLYGSRSSPEIQYLSNWPTTTEAHLVFPLDGEPTLFVQLSNHVPVARRAAIFDDVRFGGSSPTGSVDSVPSVIQNLTERGYERARIGIVGGLPYQQYGRLRQALPDATWSDSGAMLRDLRQIKSSEEIERIRQSAELSDRSVAALAEQVRPGLREHELARVVEDAYLGEGGTNTIHFMVTTPMRNPQRGVPQQYLTNRVIEKGDMLSVEISTNVWGYSGQILRTFTIGEEPTAEYRRLHDVAEEAFYKAESVLRPGATVADILDAADVVTERGYTIFDDFLHGANQLPPIVRTRQTYRGEPPDFQFKADMCCVIQPNVVTEDAKMGVQFGEQVHITATGVERLHTYPRQLIVCRST